MIPRTLNGSFKCVIKSPFIRALHKEIIWKYIEKMLPSKKKI